MSGSHSSAGVKRASPERSNQEVGELKLDPGKKVKDVSTAQGKESVEFNFVNTKADSQSCFLYTANLDFEDYGSEDLEMVNL